jgi:uncharacterized protein (TIGR00251 family)
LIEILSTHDGISFSIHVQPRASKNEIKGLYGNSLKVLLTAPPVEGEANKACIDFFSKIFKTAKSNIKIISGEKNRSKIIKVFGKPNELENILLLTIKH